MRRLVAGIAICLQLARFCVTAYHTGYTLGPSACATLVQTLSPQSQAGAKLVDLATTLCYLGASDAAQGRPAREGWVWETAYKLCVGEEM